jgi:hypothetical protein
MLMRPKHSLVRLLTLKASGGHDLIGSPVTNFLLLRYRVQGFKVRADTPDQDGMITVIS